MSMHGDWHIKYRIVFQVTDGGNFDATVSGASVSVSVALEPTIRTTGCTCDIDGVKIDPHGGSRWLYGHFVGAAEPIIRDEFKRKICDAARRAITRELRRRHRAP